MDLRCLVSCTGPGSAYFEKGRVYALPHEKYDPVAHPYLQHFDPPPEAAKAPKKGKRDESLDDLTK